MFCACVSFDLLIFFNWLWIPKTLPFLLLPNANLNPDIQQRIAFAYVRKPRPRFLVWTTHRPQTTTWTDGTIFHSDKHVPSPLCTTDHIWTMTMYNMATRFRTRKHRWKNLCRHKLCICTGEFSYEQVRKKKKRIPSIFKDEINGSCICLRSLIYMSHVNKVQPIRVKMIRIGAIRHVSLREAWFFIKITPQSGIDHNLVSVVKILLKAFFLFIVWRHKLGKVSKVIRNIPQTKDIYMSKQVSERTDETQVSAPRTRGSLKSGRIFHRSKDF
jgi:hypothetical protein